MRSMVEALARGSGSTGTRARPDADGSLGERGATAPTGSPSARAVHRGRAPARGRRRDLPRLPHRRGARGVARAGTAPARGGGARREGVRVRAHRRGARPVRRRGRPVVAPARGPPRTARSSSTTSSAARCAGTGRRSPTRSSCAPTAAATYPLANSVDDVAQGISLICRGEDLLSVTPAAGAHPRAAAPDPEDGLSTTRSPRSASPPATPSWGAARRASRTCRWWSGWTARSCRSGTARSRSRSSPARASCRRRCATTSRCSAGRPRRPRAADRRRADREFDLDASAGRPPRSTSTSSPPSTASASGSSPADELADELRALPRRHLRRGGARRRRRPTREREVVRGLVPLVQERMQRLDEVQRYAPAVPAPRRSSSTRTASPRCSGRPVRRGDRGGGAGAGRRRLDRRGDRGGAAGAAEELGIGFGKVAQPIRVAVTGSSVSPPLFESIELLDREVVLERLTPRCRSRGRPRRGAEPSLVRVSDGPEVPLRRA
jgi:hypothetical protein